MSRFLILRECILTCVNTPTRGGSALHEGELCTRDHLPIPTVVMLRSAHLADVKLGNSITP